MMYETNNSTPQDKDNNKMTSPQENPLLIIDTPSTFLYNSSKKNGFYLSLTFETADKTGCA